MRKIAKTLDLRETIGDEKFIIVGDIHGCFDEFTALLNKCGYSAGDYLISVGDLMDRGPNSKETIEWFMSAINAYVVEGNHDNKAKRYWMGRPVKPTHGLVDTIEECKNMDTESVAAWIDSLPQMIQVPDINGKPAYVVHAGVDGRMPIDQQPIENCLYARYFGGKGGFLDESGKIWHETLDGSYVIISGHMMYENPIQTENVFLLDGGAFQGGVLRALVVENGEWRIEEVKSKEYWNKTANTPPIVAARNQLVDQNMLRFDELDNLRIYTYTDDCVFARKWDEITTNSRGIILNQTTGEVVAQPFPKFFNMNERDDTQEHVLPWSEDYLVFEKMDGWLGILYRHNNEYSVATRGSFDGMGMGAWATNFLRENHDLTGLPDEVTLVFEIICPQTHIIVDYGTEEKLVLLTAYNRHTGKEYDWDQISKWGQKFKIPLPRVFESDVDACQKLLASHSGNELEGFVIRFKSGMRVKIKGEDYKRRASIVAKLTPMGIWRAMRENTLTDDYRDTIDTDYTELFDELVNALQVQYDAIWKKIEAEYHLSCKGLVLAGSGFDCEGSACDMSTFDRKTFALRVQSLDIEHKSAMFAMLDSKDSSVYQYIIKLIRPSGNVLI